MTVMVMVICVDAVVIVRLVPDRLRQTLRLLKMLMCFVVCVSV